MYGLSDGSIDKVFDFSTCEPWCHSRQLLGFNIVILSDFVEIKLEDVLSSVDIRVGHMDLLVEASWSDSCRIECILVISGSDHHNVFVLDEAVHLSQDLVKCGTTRTAFIAHAAAT